MNAGIDFGTSNCAIGVWEDNKPNILNLEGNSSTMPSALYTSKENIEVDEINEAELISRIRKSKAQQNSAARKAKDWVNADEIRDKLLAMGVKVFDEKI